MKQEKKKWLLLGCGVILVLLVLHAGLEFWEQRAAGGIRGPRHGEVGIITSVTLPTITLQTRDDETQTITISTSTLVLSGPQAQSTTSLSVGQNVVIIGEPGEARFIRILQ